jgi:hypothetical protein
MPERRPKDVPRTVGGDDAPDLRQRRPETSLRLRVQQPHGDNGKQGSKEDFVHVSLFLFVKLTFRFRVCSRPLA